MLRLTDYLIVLGDFYISSTKFFIHDTDFLVRTISRDWSCDFLTSFYDINIIQINNVFNFNKSLLDLVIVNKPLLFNVHRNFVLHTPHRCTFTGKVHYDHLVS